LFYHIVWATEDRAPLIGADHHQTIQGVIRAKGKDYYALVHAVGIMPDHVHVVASIPPSVPIATIVGRTKGSTSRVLNELMQAETGSAFAWQAEYGVLSLSERALEDVIAYANNQPVHHAANRLWRGLEQIDGSPHFAPEENLT
jgi:REP-associated tyrosine transposase